VSSTTWRRRLAIIGAIAAMHFVATCGPAAWTAVTGVPLRCWLVGDDAFDGWDSVYPECDEPLDRLGDDYYGMQDALASAIGDPLALLVWLPAIAAGILLRPVVGQSSMLTLLVAHLLGAYLFAVDSYAVWSLVTSASRRRRTG